MFGQIGTSGNYSRSLHGVWFTPTSTGIYSMVKIANFVKYSYKGILFRGLAYIFGQKKILGNTSRSLKRTEFTQQYLGIYQAYLA